MRTVVCWLGLGMVPTLGLSARLRAQTVPHDSAQVLVATRTLPRGTVLHAADLTPETRVLRRSATTSATPGPGWLTRRVIRAGEVVAAPAVTPPPTIALGQNVDFVVVHGGVELSLPATAIFSAALGDTVAVRLATQRRATGIVAGPARVVALDPRTDK